MFLIKILLIYIVLIQYICIKITVSINSLFENWNSVKFISKAKIVAKSDRLKMLFFKEIVSKDK